MMGALATDRNLPLRRSRDQEFSVDQKQAAAFVIDGQIVLVDTSDFKFDGYTPAVVIRHDETIGIENPVPYGTGVYKRGPRVSAYGVGRLSGGRFQSISPCTVIGKVIEG
jgi:hypothetical protein